MQKMFDQLGGLGRLVKGKTVAMKINLTGSPTYRVGLPAARGHALHAPARDRRGRATDGKAGARRIRILESPWSTADPVEEYILQANWEPRDILGAAPNVEFENTNYLGNGEEVFAHDGAVRRLHVPGVRPEPLLRGLRRLRQHRQDEGARHRGHHALDEELLRHSRPAPFTARARAWTSRRIVPKGGRNLIHAGNRQPSKSAPPEKDPKSPRQDTWRVPRTVVDLCAARPIHLAIVEGIKTMTGGEGPWIREELTGVCARA